MANKYINIKGRLVATDYPLVMGILNVTPDSFHAASRMQTEAEIRSRIETIFGEGGDMIDVGACSTRPGAELVPVEVEKERLRTPLEILKNHYPDKTISVDTYRAEVARWAVGEYGVAIINDISGGIIDPDMFPAVADLQVPYVLMHTSDVPFEMQMHTAYDNLILDIRKNLAEKIYRLRELGLNDIIVDPGFGFGKTVNQNYQILANLDLFSIFDLPILVGLSRKSMLSSLTGGGPEDALNTTVVANVLALLFGANILRVHDVREAVETVKVVQKHQESILIKNEIRCGRK
jgi:dihydropteroate synthase